MGFYGIVRAVTDLVPRMTAPVLVLAAGADQATSPEENAAFDRALTDAGVDHELVEYAGAPHSFFDQPYADWERRLLRQLDPDAGLRRRPPLIGSWWMESGSVRSRATTGVRSEGGDDR